MTKDDSVTQSDYESCVCLAGRRVSRDRRLIGGLKSHGLVVTAVEEVSAVDRQFWLENAKLLVLDCSGCAGKVLGMLPGLTARFPALNILLIDGRLEQAQIAGAFQRGIKDYFRDPYDVPLLVERIVHLCGTAVPGAAP